MTATTTLDLQAIKARQKAMWTAGDFGQIAKFTQSNAVEFVERCAVKAGSHLLDVACGTGNVAIPAAKAGAVVTGLDIVPNLLAQARARADRESLKIRFDEGDMENLPYDDASFDLVTSMFGAMFGPRPKRVAAELIRVCRPGGRIAMASWTPRGFIGQTHQIMAKYAPMPSGLPSPLLWGEEATVRECLGDGIADLRVKAVMAQLRYPFSIAETVAFHQIYLGPARLTFETMPEDKRAAVQREMEALYAKYNKAQDGTTWVEAEYLDVVATRA
jgi:ubiquinone/menaquinone biosynthesis C-methylase UbiE